MITLFNDQLLSKTVFGPIVEKMREHAFRLMLNINYEKNIKKKENQKFSVPSDEILLCVRVRVLVCH